MFDLLHDTIVERAIRVFFFYDKWFGALIQLFVGVSPETANTGEK